MIVCLVFAFGFLGLSCPILAQAPEAVSPSSAQAQKVFDQLYGERLKSVARTAELKDDLELAKELRAAAVQSPQNPQLVVILARNAVKLASKKPDGYEIAAEAHQLIAATDSKLALPSLTAAAELMRKSYIRAPRDQRPVLGDKLITAYLALAEYHVRQKQYTPAVVAYQKAYRQAIAIKSDRKEDVKIDLDAAVAARRIERSIELEKAKLKRNPKDTNAARELIRLYLVELDDPKGALPFTLIANDIKTRANIALARAELTELDEAKTIQLADWYMQLAASTQANQAKSLMLRRADKYYAHFLTQNSTDSLAKTKATLARSRIEKQLARLDVKSGTASKGGKWIDLLSRIDINRDTIRGQWAVRSKKLSVSAGFLSAIRLPVEIQGSYEFEVKFTLTSGATLVVILPVGKSVTTLQLGRADYTKKNFFDGLQTIKGQQVTTAKNPSRTASKALPLNKSHTVLITVIVKKDNVAVQATLNGSKAFAWSGPQADLALEPQLGDMSGNAILGLLANRSDFIYHSLRIKSRGGKITPKKVSKKKTPPASARLSAEERAAVERLAPLWKAASPEQRRRLIDVARARGLTGDRLEAVIRALDGR